MGKLFALGLCMLAAGCAEGSDTFTPVGGASQGGGPPASGGGSEGGGSSDCGNGIANEGEECDGSDLEVTACEDLGFVGGELACSKACEFDTSACLETLCDNGVLDDGEECDGTELGTATCATSGFAGGPLTCVEETCVVDTTACKPNLEEGFEGATPPDGFLAGNWFLDTSTFHGGLKSIRAGDINDSGTTAMNVVVTFEAAGSIAFWHREQTETCCDLLHFSIDGVQQAVYATDSWQSASFPVGVGTHTFEWRYTKDGSLSTGADTVWVDDILATGGYLN